MKLITNDYILNSEIAFVRTLFESNSHYVNSFAWMHFDSRVLKQLRRINKVKIFIELQCEQITFNLWKIATGFFVCDFLRTIFGFCPEKKIELYKEQCEEKNKRFIELLHGFWFVFDLVRMETLGFVLVLFCTTVRQTGQANSFNDSEWTISHFSSFALLGIVSSLFLLSLSLSHRGHLVVTYGD